MTDDTPKSGFERMLESVYRDLTELAGIHSNLLDVIAKRPQLNNDDLLTAAKLIAGEMTVLQAKDREIRYMQEHREPMPKPGRNAGQ